MGVEEVVVVLIDGKIKVLLIRLQVAKLFHFSLRHQVELLNYCCCVLLEIGFFVQPCEDDAVCKCTNEKIPYFNAPIFLENKTQIGKVDEIFGPIQDFVSFHEY